MAGPGVNSAALRASLPRPARAISFEMTPLSNDGINDGGGYAVVSRRDSHNHKLIMGPDRNGFPSAGYYIFVVMSSDVTMVYMRTLSIQGEINSNSSNLIMYLLSICHWLVLPNRWISESHGGIGGGSD